VIRTVEAVIDEQGTVRLKETVRLAAPRRAVVTIFEEDRAGQADEPTLLSEPALAQDWNRPEEDAAWSHLQSAR
jgi:hypothetical protein